MSAYVHASHNFSTLCSPQNTVKGTWIYSAGHGTEYKKNNIVICEVSFF